MVWPTLGSRTAKEQNRTSAMNVSTKAAGFGFLMVAYLVVSGHIYKRIFLDLDLENRQTFHFQPIGLLSHNVYNSAFKVKEMTFETPNNILRHLFLYIRDNDGNHTFWLQLHPSLSVMAQMTVDFLYENIIDMWLTSVAIDVRARTHSEQVLRGQ